MYAIRSYYGWRLACSGNELNSCRKTRQAASGEGARGARITETAVADIFQEVDEEVRRDQASLYWKKYGRYVIAVLVAIILGTAAHVRITSYNVCYTKLLRFQ